MEIALHAFFQKHHIKTCKKNQHPLLHQEIQQKIFDFCERLFQFLSVFLLSFSVLSLVTF